MLRIAFRNLVNHKQQLLKYDEAPDYVKFNPYIRTGYRSPQSFLECIKSVVQLHNETLNIWTHFLGFLAFGTIFVWNLISPPGQIAGEDFAVILCILTCYKACMILSAVYHTFTAHSEQVSAACLFMDLAGIGASITASYIVGIYYAFFCDNWWRNFYLTTVAGIITIGVIFGKKITSDKHIILRLAFFVTWTLYGTVPTIHFWYANYGTEVVRLFLPRVIFMYLMIGLAFFFYFVRIPERLLPGRFDILGSSHQWWHVLIFIGLAYWHNTGYTFAEFRIESGCRAEIDPELIEKVRNKFWLVF